MEVVWADRATGELEKIGAYIARSSPQNSVLVLQRIAAASQSLGNAPLSGRPGRLAGTRELPVARTGHLLMYEIKDNRVNILAVRRGARRWPKSRPR